MVSVKASPADAHAGAQMVRRNQSRGMWPSVSRTRGVRGLTNSGPAAGAEVIQVYLGVPAQGQPPKRLIGLKKVFLEPGESRG